MSLRSPQRLATMTRLPLTPALSPDVVAGDGARRPNLFARLAAAHAQRAHDGLLRQLRTVERVDTPRIVIDDQLLLDFASNDYLGLAQHRAVREALIDTANRHGVGARAAHLLGGHRAEHAALEEKLAAWTGRERALLFSTGYMANLGAIVALIGKNDVCAQDKLNHASLLDGARLSCATLKRYAHVDVTAAARQLRSCPGAAAMLVTDGVFSMDGDTAPLRELAALCKTEHALLMVDDAHGLGVLGPEGAGSLAAAGLDQAEAPVLMATLGKALGVAGAFVAGSAALIDGLLQFARSYIYTTAMPAALAAAASAAIDVARGNNDLRNRLQQHIAHLRSGAADRGIALLASSTPIQAVVIGSSAKALEVSRRLFAAGFHVPAIRPPTVAATQARLRISLSAAHTSTDIEHLLNALDAALASHARLR